MRFLFVFLPLLCGGILFAQEKPKTRTCRILFLDRPTDAPATMHLFDGKVSREVDLPGMNLSKEYELPAGLLRLSLVPDRVSAPEMLPAGAPFLTVPETMSDFYLLLFQDAANKVAPVRMQIVDASMQRLRPGQTYWFNLTGLTIGGKLGDENIVLNPMSRSVMDAPRSDAGDYQVSMAYRKPDVKAQYPICETRWVHDPRARNLGFIVPKDGSRTPRVFVIPDFRAEKEKNKEAELP